MIGIGFFILRFVEKNIYFRKNKFVMYMLFLKLKKFENGLGLFLVKNIFFFIDLDVIEDMLGM